MPLYPFRATALAIAHLASAATAVAGTFEARVRSGSWGVEEQNTGSVSTDSEDLEMVTSGGQDQTVGVRWEAVAVPKVGNHHKRLHPVHRGEDLELRYPTAIYSCRATQRETRDRSRALDTTCPRGQGPPPRRRGRLGGGGTRDAAGPDQQVDVTPIVPGGGSLAAPIGRSGNWIAFITTGSGHRAAWIYDGGRAPRPRCCTSTTPPRPTRRRRRSP